MQKMQCTVHWGDRENTDGKVLCAPVFVHNENLETLVSKLFDLFTNL